MRCNRTTSLSLPVLVSLSISLMSATAALDHAGAQGAQQQGSTAAKLELTTNSAAAKAEFWAGLEDWQSFAYSSAERHFRRALALDEGFGLARIFASGMPALSQAQLRERDRAVGEAARQSTVEGIVALAWREKALGHAARAADLLHAAMQLAPNEPAIALEYIWSSFERGGNPKEVLDSARAYRARFPNYAPFALPIPVLLMATGDTTAALRASEEYTRVAPRTPASFGYYGGLLQTLGRYDEAEAAYRQGLSLAPVHADYGADAASALAELYELRGRNADARAVATQALARALDASDSAMYMTEIAGTYFIAGDAKQGMQLLESARQKSARVGSRNGPEFLDGIIAQANAIFGDGHAVSSTLARLEPIEPNDSVAVLVWRASTYAFAGQVDSARIYSDRLVAGATSPETKWRIGFAHGVRGVALATAKQCAAAREELLQSDTTSVINLDVRAQCELQQGHKAAALALRDRALAQHDYTFFSPAFVRARMRLAQIK